MDRFISIFQRHESEVRGYCRNFNVVFESAKGSIITAENGQEYIDFLASCGALNYGHNHPRMKEALVQHLMQDGLSSGLDLFSTTKAALLETFHEYILKPRQLNYHVQFTGPTGTNAVEAALKLARKVTQRTNVIAFTNGFHGVSLGALAATGNKFNRMNHPGLFGVSRAPYEHYGDKSVDSAAYLEHLLSDPSSGIDVPAAILLETVQGEGGLNAASAEWLQAIAAIAKRHGALLIVDDIQAGCGRTGTFFSFENIGIEPDIVVMSKSISGFGLPMALVLMKPEHDQWEPAQHNGTFRGNTHAFVTARVSIEQFWKNEHFSQTLVAKAAAIRAHLKQIAQYLPEAQLKGRGMMQGIAVASGKAGGDLASKICQECFRNQLLIETSGAYGEVVKILAPLTTPLDLLEQGLGILEQSVKTVMSSSAMSGTVTHAHTSPSPVTVPLT